MKILELAGNESRNNKKVRITSDHVDIAIKGDDELSKLFNTAQNIGINNKPILIWHFYFWQTLCFILVATFTLPH